VAASTGPVLAAGAIVFVNEAVLAPAAGQGPATWNWRVIPAVAALALALDGLEHIAPGFAKGLAWLTLATALIVPVGNAPTPFATASKALGFTGKAIA
jgi:hypothetical protein